MTFGDRAQAGQQLAQVLFERGGFADALVLALPRGGVPVAFEAARRLATGARCAGVRKLGVPGHGEYAFGAIASGGVTVIDDGLVRLLGLEPGRDRGRGAHRALGTAAARARLPRRPTPRTMFAGARCCWSTTGWPPARRCGPPFAR
jgi:hypothetical protein